MVRIRRYLKTAFLWIASVATGIATILFIFRRKNISNGNGVQPDTRGADTIRDGIKSVEDGVTESTNLVDRSTAHIEQSIEHTGNATEAVQRARGILDRAKQRSTEGSKES